MTAPELKFNLNTFGNSISSSMGSSLGNNPFGAAGSNFINCIFQGGNFWDAMGQSASSMGMQAASMAMNSIFSAVGGAITNGLSLAGEKAKNKASEVKINKENKAAEDAAQQGVVQAEGIINEAAGKIDGYKADLDEQIKIIEESTEIVAAKKEALLENIELIQQQIETFETEKARRDELEAKLNSTTDETEKEKLQKQLAAANEICATYAPVINELHTNIIESADSISQEIYKANQSQAWAGQLQQQLAVTTTETQDNLDNTVVTTNNSVVSHTGAAAQETATLRSNSLNQTLTGERILAMASAKSVLPIIGTAMSGLDTAVGQGYITTGTAGTSTAQLVAGVIQGFGSDYTNKFNGVQNSLPEINTNIGNIGAGTDTLLAMAELNIEEGTSALEMELPENPIEEEEVQIV